MRIETMSVNVIFLWVNKMYYWLVQRTFGCLIIIKWTQTGLITGKFIIFTSCQHDSRCFTINSLMMGSRSNIMFILPSVILGVGFPVAGSFWGHRYCWCIENWRVCICVHSYSISLYSVIKCFNIQCSSKCVLDMIAFLKKSGDILTIHLILSLIRIPYFI